MPDMNDTGDLRCPDYSWVNELLRKHFGKKNPAVIDVCTSIFHDINSLIACSTLTGQPLVHQFKTETLQSLRNIASVMSTQDSIPGVRSTPDRFQASRRTTTSAAMSSTL